MPDNRLYKALITYALDLGEAMLKCGAEVSRVEDSLQRIFSCYGATDVDVLTITSCIILTVTFSAENVFTQTRRIKSSNTDFDHLSRLNALSRFICDTRPEPEEIRARLEQIEKEAETSHHSLVCGIVGTVCATGGFAVFFGGKAADFAAAVLVGLFMLAFEKLFRKKITNIPLYNFLCMLCAGLVTLLICRVFPAVDRDKVLIGAIMVIIPGVAFTNAARDILLGDTISGSLRLLESVLYAASIAGGIAVALLAFGGGI